MKSFAVYVQHPAFEHNGEVYPNFVFVGTIVADDAECALLGAKEAFKEEHAPSLLAVEPLED